MPAADRDRPGYPRRAEPQHILATETGPDEEEEHRALVDSRGHDLAFWICPGS